MAKSSNEHDLYEALKKYTYDNDFGSQIIPGLIGKVKIATHLHEGYWADIGTISAFYQANIQATKVNPPFPLYSPGHPIFTHMRSLAPARIIRSAIRDSLVAEGTDLHGAIISDSVIGVRSMAEVIWYLDHPEDFRYKEESGDEEEFHDMF